MLLFDVEQRNTLRCMEGFDFALIFGTARQGQRLKTAFRSSRFRNNCIQRN